MSLGRFRFARALADQRMALGAGVLFALMLILLAASPASAEEIPAPEVKEYQSDLGVSKQTAEENLTTQAEGIGIVEELQHTQGQNYAGVWFDNASGEFVVPRLTGEASIESSLDGVVEEEDFRTKPVEYSWDELEAAQKRITLALKSLTEESLIQTALDPRTNAIVVLEAAGLNEVGSEKVERVVAAEDVNVEVRERSVASFAVEAKSCTTSPPRVCSKPLRGGVDIGIITPLGGGAFSYSSGVCSAGFKAIGKVSGDRYMLTAGHCALVGNRWGSEVLPSNEFQEIGTVQEHTIGLGGDWAKIKASGSFWDTSPWPSEVTHYWANQTYPIEYESASYRGEYVCLSGSKTGTTCGHVANVHVEGLYDEKHDIHLPVEVEVPGICTIGGDSGGPIFNFSSNTALGLLSAGAGPEECGSPYEVAYYVEITEATDALGVTVGTRVGATPVAETLITGDDEYVVPPDFTLNKAVLHGEVDPNGITSNYHVEYGTTTGYGSSTSLYGAGSGWSPTPVEATLKNLNGSTTYHYRFVAQNSAGTGYGEDHTFTTPKWGPPQWPTETPKGAFKEDPGICSSGPGHLDAVARGQDDTLWHRSWNGTSWSEWEGLGGNLTTSPSCTWRGNMLDVVALGTYKDTWHWTRNGSTWSSENLGGIGTSGPAVCSTGPGRIDVFERGSDGALWRKYWDGSKWVGWESLGGSLASGPSCVQRGNMLDVVALGTYKDIWHWTLNGSTWSSENLNGIGASDPGLCSWGPERLDVFVRGTEDSLWHKYWDGSKWVGWEELGGALASAPDCVSWSKGRIDIATRDGEDLLTHWHWQQWPTETPKGAFKEDPGICSSGPGHLDAVARGQDDTLWHRSWNGTSWSEWEGLGGNLTTSPSCTWRGNMLDVVALGTYKDTWHWTRNGSTWSSENLGGIGTSGPAVCSTGPGRIDVFARGSDGALWRKYWDGSKWVGWESLGGSLASGPSCVQRGNMLDVVALGTYKDIWHWTLNGSTWSSENLNGIGASDPGLCSWGPERLDVFVRREDNALWRKYWDGSKWVDWEKLGGALASAPDCVSWGKGRIDLATRDGEDLLTHWHWQLPPTPAIESPSAQATQATLKGTLYPEGLPTTYYFECGKTTAYGTKVPTSAKSAGSGTSSVAVSEAFAGLEPATTYHCRLLAENESGASWSEDQAFETKALNAAGPLAGMALTEPFDGSSQSLANFSANWSALGWAAGGTPKGSDTTTGWRSAIAYPTVNGAYYGTTVSDAGWGTAAAATLAANPGVTERHFSLWLDMPTPSTAMAGYELRFTNTAANTYKVTLSKWVGGTQTELASKSSYTFSNGNSLALVDLGGAVSAWTNTGSGFSQLLSAADSSFAEGKAGLQGAGSNTRLTNFKAGVLLGLPKATTEAATGVKATQATLNGAVNPEGAATGYYFEYGKTTSYGTKVPTSPAAAGSGTSSVAVNQTPTGLSAGTVYHYRLVAENEAGAANGEDKTFTTEAAAPPDTTITAGSTGTVTPDVSFAFTSSESGSSFECSLDQGSYSACTSPKSYEGLSEGSHTFRVRAVGAGGADPTPAERSVNVVETAKAVSGVFVLDDFGRSENPLANGKWTKTNWATKIGASWTGSWHGYGGWGSTLVGAYWNGATFSDASAGLLVSATLGTGPTASGEYLSLWLDMPNPGSARSGYEARFTGTNGSSSNYKVELSKWVSGTRTVLGTKEGFSLSKDTTFTLTETGGALTIWTGTSSFSRVLSAYDTTYTSGYAGIEAYGGNGTAYDFRAGSLAVPPPDTTITAGSTGTVTPDVSFAFTSSESGSSFECSLDQGSYSACTSPKSYQGLAEGSHTFRVRAVGAGGADPTPAERSVNAIETAKAVASVAVLDNLQRQEVPLATGKWTKTNWAEEIGSAWSGQWNGYGANGNHLAGAYWNQTTFSDASAGLLVSATLGTGPTASGEYLSLWLDMPNPGSARSGYEARFTGTNGSSSNYKVELSKWVSGTRTVLGSKEGFSLPVNTIMALTETGGALTLWTGTSTLTSVLSANDSTYSSGYAGLEANKGEGTEYNFRAGKVS